jgi:hypothetical protein
MPQSPLMTSKKPEVIVVNGELVTIEALFKRDGDV